jgi:hypothetical protein
MTHDEVVAMVAALPGVVVQTPVPGSEAPEIAWGDSFFFYDPDDSGGDARMFAFATVVTKDYPGFDESSRLDRPGAFRLNINVGRERFTQLFGFAPSQVDDHRDAFDPAAADVLVPHPAYGQQAWVSVVCPGPATLDAVRELVAHAHARTARRHRPG